MPTVLTVCTGNICRSPAAELLLQRELGDAITVASAGTHALVGHGIPAPMLTELAADGIDGAAHQGALLTEAVMRDADVIITMTRDHRRLAVQTAPGALKRTFTLAEVAAAAGTGATLTGTTVAERLASLPAAIAAHRHILADFDLSDVPDPYRRSQDAYHESYTMIRGAAREIGAWLRG
ncbi:low molecular weight phosphatase family protein [Demequina sp. SYSU T00039]|uniref:Low molecular weight phosphatase family protein n=1 Tax=Demequina lignilytica TaxID=3051663 RepID=A0AAW7M6U8_9MICO|nr:MULTISPECIES: low molecular weight phosphatase family protein [unclassified Demequina]MDN4477428.1 low molecular weight phosphatase family protein [Demequina sp. SYSU T00039-1]MDN4488221.1 low molecular weight phosphatase family protein [Demequina sp. SYSU T00039]